MVAPTQHDGPASSTADAPRAQTRPRHRRGGARRLFSSIARFADLQFHLWLTQAKVTLLRMALYAALFIVAAGLAILAIIFLGIGVFHILTDLLQLPVWAACLIFGGAAALSAIVLLIVATRLLTGRSTADPAEAPGKRGGDS